MADLFLLPALPTVSNYLKHLRLARAFSDNAGEARANSSLANALVQLNDIPKALYFLVVKYKLAEKLADESMKRSTLDEIKKLIKFNPSAIVNTEDDRICLDASFDPDNLVDDSEMMDFDSIGDSSVPRNHLLVPNSESGLNNSASAAALMCQRFLLHAQKRLSNSIEQYWGLLPTPKNDGSQPADASFLMSTDCGLNRVSAMCKSMPHIESNEEDDFFNCLMRVQGNRINEQRADAGILKDRTNNEDMRQSDNMNMRDMSAAGTGNSSSSSNRRVSLGAAHLVKSMGSQFHKSVIKPFSSSSLLHRSNRPHSFYGTLPTDTNNTSSSSSKSKTKTKRRKLTKCKSVALVPEVKEEEPEDHKSPVFRAPHLPVQKGGKSVQMAPSPQTTPYSCSTISSSPSLRKWHKEMARKGGNDQHNPETILDLIEAIQSRRMDEQRADLFNLGVHRHSDADGGSESLEGDELVDERLYELIVQSQADRLEDQRSELGGRQPQQQQQHKKRPSNCSSTNDDDFVDDGGVCLLVERMQVGRINEQRAHFSPSQVEDMENNSPNSRNNSPSIALA
uniref:LisH domain-containing protein n=1 Tax=Ditylenchus dipsaci TaxID=166011 RepID=A0A915EK54_9BILA